MAIRRGLAVSVKGRVRSSTPWSQLAATFCRRRRWTRYYTTKTRVWTAGFSLPLRFMDGGGPCAITPAGSTLGVPDDQIRRLRPRRPMPRWPRTGGRGLWSRTAVSGRRGGGRRVTPRWFNRCRSRRPSPRARSRSSGRDCGGLAGCPQLRTVTAAGPRGGPVAGHADAGLGYPCVIRSPPPDPAWDLHTARVRAIDLHLWFT